MKATLPEPEIVTRKGKPVSVIIPIKDYEELLERVEDSDDVAWLKRARIRPLYYRPQRALEPSATAGERPGIASCLIRAAAKELARV
jgi:antitoxin (DNA-binding transcriptional repressor) of toxin-antitoxin stability system